MKKSSSIWWGFIIVAIIAIIKTGSFMRGIGFALALVIGGFALICIITAICLVFSCYEKIRDKEIMDAIGDIVLIPLLAFLGIAILKWLFRIL